MNESEKKYIRKRMIEIFQDYAMDKDEEYVQIDMYFRKNNGEEQYKVLSWSDETEPFNWEDAMVCAADIPDLDGVNVTMPVHCPVCGSQVVTIRHKGLLSYVECECGEKSTSGIQLDSVLVDWGIKCNKAERENHE